VVVVSLQICCSEGKAMQDHARYILREYWRATGWNEDNSYSNLTRSSRGSLRFFARSDSNSLARC
jgi:hypothetical protein